MSDGQAITTIRTYDDLRLAIDARRREKGLTMLDLDAVTGLTDGYSAKLCCGMRHFGSLSFGLVLQALGMELVVRQRAA